MKDFNKILRIGDLVKLLRLSRSTIWRRVKTGNLPKPFILGGGNAINSARGWSSCDIDSWIEKQKSLSETKENCPHV